MIFNEIFHSIQGEGLNAGKSAIFVRFGNCNLKCTWCDSAYTWKAGVSDNLEVPVENIIEQIKKYPCKHLVITGGEPMLQQGSISAIRNAFPDYYIEVETNGSQPIKCADDVNLFTVSYKTANSGNAPYELKTTGAKCVYKFVVTSPDDFPEIEEIISLYNLPANKIFLMPEGVTKEALEAKSPQIIEYCKKRGYRFTPRLHIMAFGNARKT